MSGDGTNSRLDRIETKMDKLVDAMTNLVRLEEKQHLHQIGMQRLGVRTDKLEKDVGAIKEKMPLINLMLSAFGKVGISVLVLITVGVIGSFVVFQ